MVYGHGHEVVGASDFLYVLCLGFCAKSAKIKTHSLGYLLYLFLRKTLTLPIQKQLSILFEGLFPLITTIITSQLSMQFLN